MQDSTSHGGVESRAAARTNLFLAATLNSADVGQPVKIRDPSSIGARIETSLVPEVGAAVTLVRGRLSVDARVSWHAGHFCGLSFTSPVSLQDWMTNPAILEEHSRAAPEHCEPGTAGGGVQDLERVLRLLKSLNEALVRDPAIVMKHGVKLQNLNLAMHTLTALSETMQAGAAEGAEGIGRRDKRRS